MSWIDEIHGAFSLHDKWMCKHVPRSVVPRECVHVQLTHYKIQFAYITMVCDLL